MTALALLDAPAELLPPETRAYDRDPRAVYLASLSTVKSRLAMVGALERVAAVLGMTARATPWILLRYQHTKAIRANLAAKYSPATCNQARAALRGVLREAMRLGLMSAEDATRAMDIQPVRGVRLPAGRALAQTEVRELLSNSDPTTPGGARDLALVAVLRGCGLRRAEAVGLDLADYRPREESIRVLGKGNKERLCPLPDAARVHLDRWLAVRGDEPGPLFLPVTRMGKVLRRRMADQSVADILSRVAQRAGVTDVSPHDMRRTYVTELLDQGVDAGTVQKMAGHAQVTTTLRYDRRGDDAMKRAARGITM